MTLIENNDNNRLLMQLQFWLPTIATQGIRQAAVVTWFVILLMKYQDVTATFARA